VVHDDSFAWLRAAAAREGFGLPDIGSFEGERTGAADAERALEEALVELALGGPEHVAERARRELARRLGAEVPPVPPASGPTRTGERELWRQAILAAVGRRYGG